MLYTIAHYFRDHIPWLWDMIDIVNSFLFTCRYGSKLKTVEERVLNKYSKLSGYKVAKLCNIETDKLVHFFACQPEEAYTFFRPHGFDANSIRKLKKNKAFLAYVLIDGNTIVAYCFNRSFFHGKGFRGRMVDIGYRGKSLGTMTNKLLNEVGFGIGLRLFETVSKDNVASYRSAISASKFKVIKELPHNELYLEIIEE